MFVTKLGLSSPGFGDSLAGERATPIIDTFESTLKRADFPKFMERQLAIEIASVYWRLWLSWANSGES